MKRNLPRIEGWKALFRAFWLMTCTSYTGVVLFMSLFSPLGWERHMDSTTALQLFLLCVTISLAMLFWDIPEHWLENRGVPTRVLLVLDPLLRCAAVLAIVLLEGVAFGFFPMEWNTVLGLLPIEVPVFIVTYAATSANFHRAQKDAEEINERIRKQKKPPLDRMEAEE